MLKQIKCTKCGGELIKNLDTYKCSHCNSIFVEDYINQVNLVLDKLELLKQEKIAALRERLWEQVNAPNLSSTEISSIAKELRSYLPDDFLACFYEKACSKNKKEITKFLSSIDINKEYVNLDLVIEFMIKSITEENLIFVNNLVEVYKDRDLKLYDKYTTLLSIEAEKVRKGVYELNIPRDVFIAYSSKDIKLVDELTEFLESKGISCFVALRNLRHGAGAVENYDRALEKAIYNSKVFVYISTKNSRKLDCDAVKKEIPYIKKLEIEHAPAKYKQNYDVIPEKYKRPKIELLVDKYNEDEPTYKLLHIFFNGYEWCYNNNEVLDRVVHYIADSSWYEIENEDNSKKQYCVNCFVEVPEGQKFCGNCGSNEFTNSISELIDIVEQKRKPKEKHYCINCLMPSDIDIDTCDNCKNTIFEKDYKIAVSKYIETQRKTIREEEKSKLDKIYNAKNEELKNKEKEINEKQEEEYNKFQKIVNEQQNRFKQLESELKNREEEINKKQQETFTNIKNLINGQKDYLQSIKDDIQKKEEVKKQQEELIRKQKELERQQEVLRKQQENKKIVDNTKLDSGLQRIINSGNKTYTREGNFIYFGSYPQGENGEIEPIKWRILSEENGEALLLSEYILDARMFDMENNNYKNSEIRMWLNNDFYNKAFNDNEKQIILTTNVDNSERSTNPNGYANEINNGKNQYACENTQDKVFLLSMQEVTNTKYGFNADRTNYDDVRNKKPTVYAIKQGAYTNSNGNGYWWLRSPYYGHIGDAWCVSNDGYVFNYYVYNTRRGVAGALKIKLLAE